MTSPRYAVSNTLAAHLCALLIVLALVAAVFGQALAFGFLEWDDNGYVRDNGHVLGGLSWPAFTWALTSFEQANWHPLTWWSYQLDITLFGPAPQALHGVNVVLHALNSALVYTFFNRLGLGWPRALLAAALFAVHPLHVESVVWIAERKDLLCAFFMLASLLAWDRHVRTGRRAAYAVALVLAALAMMAKAMAVTLPLLLLLLDAWPYARLRGATPAWRDPVLRARLIEKLPFVALVAVCAGLTYAAQAAGGALRPLQDVGLFERLGNAATAYALYLVGSVWPHDLSFLYRYEPPTAAAVGAALVLLVLLSIWAWRKRGATAAGWLWFVLSLLPVIGLIKIGEHARADRYMYLPLIGVLLLLAAALPDAQGLSRARWRLVWGAAAAAVLALALVAQRYASQWHDSQTLFEHALALDPRHAIAHSLLAATHERGGQAAQVYAHAEAALHLQPRSIAAASAAISASNAARASGDHALARRYLERAIAAAPAFAKPHYNLGTLLLQAGEPLQAVAHFERAIALHPRYAQAYNNLGVAWRQLDQRPRAIDAFAQALRLDPDNRAAQINLARAQGRDPALPAR